MKRTELKRGTTPMKRAAIKPRAKRHRDTTASLALREQYRRDNPTCEVTNFMWKTGLWRYTKLQTGRLQCDHLWGGTAGRNDLWSMLIMVCDGWHTLKTENPTLGLLLFLIVKANKPSTAAWECNECGAVEYTASVSQDDAEAMQCAGCGGDEFHTARREVSDAEFRQCSGRASLDGWLTTDTTIAACPPWLEPYRLKLVESLEVA